MADAFMIRVLRSESATSDPTQLTEDFFSSIIAISQLGSSDGEVAYRSLMPRRWCGANLHDLWRDGATPFDEKRLKGTVACLPFH